MPHPNAPPRLTGPLAELRWWPWQPLAKYPRMRDSESLIMAHLLEGAPDFALSVCYDIDVGPAGCECSDPDPQLQQLVDTCTRCRVDALAWDGSVYWLIELKSYALPGAVGQVLVYLCLIGPDLPPDSQVIPLLAARAIHNGTQLAADCLGVATVLVAADELRFSEPA